ncbi:hypothetical protein TNCV_4966981 [Trichonephila clavipes]|nr:hypothetical protein TNCV_4966981 [Trichonephila clavipes]
MTYLPWSDTLTTGLPQPQTKKNSNRQREATVYNDGGIIREITAPIRPYRRITGESVTAILTDNRLSKQGLESHTDYVSSQLHTYNQVRLH